jgi:uncharacterized caspase-like protein
MIDQCRSRQIVVILDGGQSGAFVDTAHATQGIVILTSSDRFQYSFEEGSSSSSPSSIFSRNMVEGLETGKADLDSDGIISHTDLYEYIYDHMKDNTSHQIPMQWIFGVNGKIIIAKNPNMKISLAGMHIDRDLIKKYYRTSHAIIIGIGKYIEENSLPNAQNDAMAIKQVLEEKYGFDNLIPCLNDEATKSKLEEIFVDTLQDESLIGPKDRLLIYYSGHGKLRRTIGYGGQEIRKGYIVPCDSQLNKYGSNISMETIVEGCQSCKAKHILLILDCCYSGYAAMRDGEPKKPENFEKDKDEYLNDTTSRRTIQVIAAGQEDQPVGDSGIRTGYSPFTGALLDILEPGLDLDNDGLLTASEIVLNVKKRVNQHIRDGIQVPVYNHLSGSALGDFVFKIFNRPVAELKDSVTEHKNVDVIQHYKSRSELPPFDKMLSIAEVTVEMSGLDFRIVVHQFMTDIIRLIHADVCVTFWLLNPDSKEVDTQSKIFFAVDDLKESIHKSIRVLCEEKQKLPPSIREKLIIRLYDSPSKYSIIAIDEGHENAWIKVEERPIGSDSSSRPSNAWYRRDDPARYDQFMREFDTMYKNSREYGCPIS